MKRVAQKVALMAGVMLVVGGCFEAEAPDSRMGRLIVLENEQLKKDLAQRDKEIADLEGAIDVCGEQIELQERIIEGCRKERDGYKEQVNANFEDQLTDILDAAMEENRILRADKRGLEARIEELEKRVD
jgi:hypothetical protein